MLIYSKGEHGKKSKFNLYRLSPKPFGQGSRVTIDT
nr:MAG TPA: hypothetical protein [Caudoviricetes sp.]